MAAKTTSLPFCGTRKTNQEIKSKLPVLLHCRAGFSILSLFYLNVYCEQFLTD